MDLRRAALIAEQVSKNAAMAFPPLARWRISRGRTTLFALSDPRFLDRYVWPQLELIGGLRPLHTLNGLRIAEIGPGDYIPVSIPIVAAGGHYVGIDRFARRPSSSVIEQLTSAIVPQLALRFPAIRTDVATTLSHWATACELLTSPIETLQLLGDLDLLFSFNAVEHLSNIAAFAEGSFQCLKPGGTAIHRIDYGPHAPWTLRPNPLEWLTIYPDLWRAMGSRRGTPNRWRHGQVVAALRRAGFQVHERVCEEFAEHHLREVLPQLASDVRSEPLDSLRVQTAVLVCTKPASLDRAFGYPRSCRT